jgi:hypothetical protein
MPELGGSYLLTLSVPGGDNSTAATLAVTHASTGTVESPSVSADSDAAYSAVFGPIDAFGWYVATWTVTGTGANVKSSRFYVAPTPDGFGVWPPSLVDLRVDMGDRDDQDDSKDPSMSMVLDAAVQHVRDIKGWKYDIAAVEESGVVKVAPTAALILGTIRLAARWHSRRSTQDNLMTLGDAGGLVVPGYDSDIERLLQVGRFTPMSEAFA